MHEIYDSCTFLCFYFVCGVCVCARFSFVCSSYNCHKASVVVRKSNLCKHMSWWWVASELMWKEVLEHSCSFFFFFCWFLEEDMTRVQMPVRIHFI